MGGSLDNWLLISLAACCAISAYFTIISTTRISSLLSASIFSALSAINYVALKAPDVAITEVAVGSALSTVLFFLSLTRLNQSSIKIHRNNFGRFFFRIVSIATSWIILVSIFTKTSAFGVNTANQHQGISEYYITNTLSDFHIPNIVTAILGGYRGFDTLFETTVIAVAALGVTYILKRE